jgi:hypothetical protein
MFGKRNDNEGMMSMQDSYSPPVFQRVHQSTDSDMEYAEQIRNEKIANVIGQINPDILLDEIEHRIKGERKKNGEWVKIIKDAPDNSILSESTISYLSSIINQSTTMGNLSSMQINSIMGLVIEYVLDDIDNYAIKYGLHDNYTERTRIAHIVIIPVFMVLTRAENGMEAKRIFASLKVNENLNQAPQQKKGLLSSLKFWN